MWPTVTDWVVWSVCLSVCHSSKLCKNGWTDQNGILVEDSGRPKEPCIRWGSRSPIVRGYFGGKGRPILKYRDALPWTLPKTTEPIEMLFELWARAVNMTEPPRVAAMLPYVKLLWPLIRLHRSTTYVDAAYCYRPSSVVCESVCHTSKPCKNGCTDRDAVWVGDLHGRKEPCIRWWSRSPHSKGQFWGGRGAPL